MRQGQSLVMTPQLQQAIKLLQLSNIELAEYCEAELEKNPLLERDEAAPARGRARSRGARNCLRTRRSIPGARGFLQSRGPGSRPRTTICMTASDCAPRPDRALASRSPTGPRSSPAAAFEGDEDGLESTLAGGGTLKDHLEAQLAIAALTPDDRLICLALIDAHRRGRLSARAI